MVCTKDANGTPLKNKWVFAMMPVVRGLRLGEGFQSPDEPNIATGAVTKRLENAMARTDDNGVATFSALTFTRRGQCGEYRIEFISDGVHSDETAPIQVFATIATIPFPKLLHNKGMHANVQVLPMQCNSKPSLLAIFDIQVPASALDSILQLLSLYGHKRPISFWSVAPCQGDRRAASINGGQIQGVLHGAYWMGPIITAKAITI